MGTGPNSGGQLDVATVRFDTGQQAALVRAGPGVDTASVIKALDLAGRVGEPVLLVCSGPAEPPDDARARALNGVATALARAGALTFPTVIDDAVARGIADVTGTARAEAPDALPVLLGVAAASGVEYPGTTSPGGAPLEPHHTHVVVADSARWDGESDLRFAVADTLAAPGATALLVAGGDDVAKAEIAAALERRWPVLVAGGTGGVSDDIAREWLRRNEPPRSMLATVLPGPLEKRLPVRLRRRRAPDLKTIADEDLRRIVRDERVRVLQNDPPKLARQIAWELQDEPVLKAEWKRFAGYDQIAGRVRRSFQRFQNSILLLGVAATLVALLASATKSVALHWMAVAAPIVVSSVIALANRRGAGQRWVVLRAGAEAMKAEIYRYRTRTGLYAADKLPKGANGATPEQAEAVRPRVLADRIARLVDAVIKTDASAGNLPDYRGPLPPAMYGASEDDDGLSQMDPPAYLAQRIGDQLTYYDGRVKELDRRREYLQVLGVGAGGAGAILAAAGAAVWVGLTTAVSGAALSYLAYLQVDNTIVTYNQTKAKLGLLESGWNALGANGQTPAAFDKLVSASEALLSLELSGWVRQMTQAVDELQSEQKKATAAGGREADDQDAPSHDASDHAAGPDHPASPTGRPLAD